MDTGFVVLLVFLFGLMSFLFYLKANDVKQDGGNIFDSILDIMFVAWVFDRKE